jgi:hypothetical protein
MQDHLVEAEIHLSFNDNSGYGGTGTSSPSNVGPGGTLGGGV